MKISWSNSKLEIKEINRGYGGVFAKEEIKKRETLAFFGGYVIHKDQISLFDKETLALFIDRAYQIDDDLFFSPMTEEEVSTPEYFNHSCQQAKAGFDGHIKLVAIKDIGRGEEVTLDYAMCMTSDFFDMDCLCGAVDCRKRITGSDWKIPELQNKYKGYFQPYIEEKIKVLKDKK